MKRASAEESERNWLLVADAVLKGVWRKATASEVESIVIGLRGYSSETCRRAVKKIDPEGKFKEKE